LLCDLLLSIRDSVLSFRVAGIAGRSIEGGPDTEDGEDRLAFICELPTLPLEAIPGNLIEPCLSTAQLLPANVRATLLGRVDRRDSGVWKALRHALRE
jgi:hypothetical protein